MKSGIIFFFLFLSIINTYSQERNAVNAQAVPSNKVSLRQSKIIHEKVKVFSDNTQLSIALIRNGKPVFYGVRIQNDSLQSIDNHLNIFEIGSITKVFTATLLAQLVAENKVKLDDPINGYLDMLLKDNIQITFGQLATHTSGLPRLPQNMIITDPLNPYKEYNEANLRQYLSDKMKLLSNPGEKYEYSNLGAGLLGYLAEKIEKTSYEKLLQEKILKKYGMSSTTTNRQLVADRLVKGRDMKGAETPNWDFSVLKGCGSILSCTGDLSRFALAQLDESNKELAITRTKTFDINKSMDMALGWHIIKADTGAEWMFHNGGTGGYTSSMVIDMKKKTGAIILSNVSAFHKNMGNIDALCFELMKQLNP
ncbi:MAG: beta-lactamase family protein [Bacteroidales bacterium]|nr:beta-lactamase family protein [Bacteroidales bacterium]